MTFYFCAQWCDHDPLFIFSRWKIVSKFDLFPLSKVTIHHGRTNEKWHWISVQLFHPHKKTTKDEWLSYFDQTDLYLGESESNWSSKHQGKIKRYTLWSIEQFSVVIHIIALNQWKKLWLSIAKFSNQIQASAPYFCNLDSYRLGDTYYVWIWDSSIVPQETKETF